MFDTDADITMIKTEEYETLVNDVEASEVFIEFLLARLEGKGEDISELAADYLKYLGKLVPEKQEPEKEVH